MVRVADCTFREVLFCVQKGIAACYAQPTYGPRLDLSKDVIACFVLSTQGPLIGSCCMRHCVSDSDSPPPEFEGTRLLTAVAVVDVHTYCGHGSVA